MNVLFYVEPYIIRGRPKEFLEFALGAARVVRGLSEDGFRHGDARIFANRSIIAHLQSKSDDAVASRLMEPTDEEHAAIKAASIDWNSGAIARWVDLMRGGETARFYMEILERLRVSFPYDVVVYWGTNGAVRRYCETLGIPSVSMELGCTRSPYYETVTMDIFGSGGAAAPSRLSIDQIQNVIGSDGEPSKVDLLAFTSGQPPSPYELAFRSPPYFDGLARVLKEGRSACVYIPLQLHDDASLLLHSDYCSLKEAMASIVPKLVDAGFLCVVKTNPVAAARPGGLAAEQRAREFLSQFGERVIWLDVPIQNQILYSLCKTVVTVNSSVGFEALFHDNLVCVVGAAAYKAQGLFLSLEEVVQRRGDRAEFARKSGPLRSLFVQSYLIPRADIFHADVFLDRLCSCLHAAADGRADPAEFLATLQRRHAEMQKRCYLSSLSRVPPWHPAYAMAPRRHRSRLVPAVPKALTRFLRGAGRAWASVQAQT